MNSKETLKLIKELAELSVKVLSLHEKLSEHYFFNVLNVWGITQIYSDCRIEDGVLYDSLGNQLSNDGRCMDEEIPYFVNQSTGYLGDDYYGTMFVKVDDENTFVEIKYEC